MESRLKDEACLATQIVESLREPMVVMGPDLRVLSANAAFYRTFQLEAGETQGQLIYNLGNGQWDIPDLRRLLEEVLPRERAFDAFEIDQPLGNGGPRTMLLNGRKIEDFDLILLGIEDISERKEAELVVHAAMELAGKTIDTVREPMLVLGSDLRVRSANDSFYHYFRTAPQAIEGRLVYELGGGQWNIPRLRELLEDVLPDNDVFNDFRLEHEFPVVGRRRLLLNARRIDHVQLILLAIEDVTERERAQQALRESEQRFRVMAEKSPVVVWMMDPELGCTYINNAWSELTGRPVESGLGSGCFDALHPDDRAEVEAALEKRKEQGATRRLEYRLRRRDGDYAWVIDSIAPYYGDDGSLLGYIGSAVDITQQKAAEQVLRRANQLKDEILGMISHEFRTPLTLLSGNIDVLSHRLDSLASGEREQVLVDLRTSRDRLQRLIENMLLIARVDSGDGPDLEPISLQRVLASLVEGSRMRDETRPVTLSISPDLPPVIGSIGYIEQIFENLITNARKYGHPGTPIHISAWREGDCARVSVRDHGDHLEAEQTEQFFEPFFQAASHEHGGTGTGLGLAVCARLVDLMHGAISARPHPEGGLEVTLLLPVAEADSEE